MSTINSGFETILDSISGVIPALSRRKVEIQRLKAGGRSAVLGTFRGRALSDPTRWTLLNGELVLLAHKLGLETRMFPVLLSGDVLADFTQRACPNTLL